MSAGIEAATAGACQALPGVAGLPGFPGCQPAAPVVGLRHGHSGRGDDPEHPGR